MGAIAERSGLVDATLFTAAARLVGTSARRHGDGGDRRLHGASARSAARRSRRRRPSRAPRCRNCGATTTRRRFATGTIAVGGTLGILIPPSIILVVYAITTEQNIAKLFQAALIPGLLAAVFYCIVIALVVRRDPAPAPAHAQGRARASACMRSVGGLAGAADRSRRGRRHLWRHLHADRGAPRSAPSRCSSSRCCSARSAGRDFKESLLQTAETSAMIFAILLGAEVFDAFLALLADAEKAAELVSRLRPAAVRRHARC